MMATVIGINITQGVGWCARSIGWMRPCGLERGSDAPTVQSGQYIPRCEKLAPLNNTARIRSAQEQVLMTPTRR